MDGIEVQSKSNKFENTIQNVIFTVNELSPKQADGELTASKLTIGFDKEGLEVLNPKALVAIKALQQKTGSDLYDRLVSAYEQEAPRFIELLNQAASSRASEDLRKAAHALKSSSVNLGVVRVTAICKRLEDMGRTNALEQVAPWLVLLAREYQLACAALKNESLEVPVQ